MKPPTDSGSRIRLCLVSSSYCVGGLERLIHDLLCHLDPARFKTRVLLLGGPGPFADLLRRRAGTDSQPRSAVRVLDLRSPLGSLRSVAVAAALRRLRPHVVHAFGFRGELIVRGAGSWLGRPALVSTVANPDLTRPRAWRLLNRISARRVGVFWADCQARARDGVRRLGVPESRIRVLYPGVDSQAIRGNLHPERHAAVRQELAIPASAPVLAVLGDLRPLKGHGLVLDAAPDILRRHPQAHFVLIGADTTRGALPRRVRDSGLSSHFHLVGFQPDPLPYLAAADVLLQPSLSEGLPRAVLEAMALGKPVIASRVGGLPELVDETTGLLIPPQDAAALKQAAVDLLHQPQRGRQMGEEGRRRVETRFRRDQTLQLLGALYEELTAYSGLS